MHRLRHSSARLLVIVMILGGQTACKKPAETVKTDLAEAGYKLTPEDWFRASRDNDAAALKQFLAAGSKVDIKTPSGDTALHVAAQAGAEKSADFLLSHGLKIDQIGASDRTPLMAAVVANQVPLVRWLLRHGADPRAKDSGGFVPLMLAVREGHSGAVAELAPYTRESLDAALQLAALLGKADVIDALTNYGASSYTRMEDGRTPLMIAAENGHKEAVALLLDVGASRYATTEAGLTAADLATAAGHPEISAMILRAPQPDELALESPAEVAEVMAEFVDHRAAADEEEKVEEKEVSAKVAPHRTTPRPLEGQILSRVVASSPPRKSGTTVTNGDVFPTPPLVMRHYREREVPIRLKSVQGETATLEVAGSPQPAFTVRPGDAIPGSNLTVVRVQRRMEDSKVNPGGTTQISVMVVRDNQTGMTREWISGVPSTAHDPVALVEDAATGERFLATPGQRFKAADGTDFTVVDVRPNQLIIEQVSTGAVQTIPLRGPRG